MRRLGVVALLSLGGCSRLAHCEFDKVRAEVLDYDRQQRELRAQERQLKRHIAEFDGKIFTNQKAGVDLLRAVLVRETREYRDRLVALHVRSALIRPHHLRKVAALQQLLEAYEQLAAAYPREDFDAIRAGLAKRARATRELEAAELRIERLLQKYRTRR